MKSESESASAIFQALDPPNFWSSIFMTTK